MRTQKNPYPPGTKIFRCNREVEATRYAVYLLVPKEFLDKAMKKMYPEYFNAKCDQGKTFKVAPLAEKFKVTINVMNYALIIHGYK